MLLQEIVDNIRIELEDSTKAVWENDDSLIRAVNKTVALMSRLISKKSMVDVTVTTGGIQRLDFSGTLSDFIRIEKLEYPKDEVPQTHPPYNLVGTTIFLTGSDKFTKDKIARIIYLAQWTPPTVEAEGDYPIHLDDAVIIGAAGQAQIFKAEYYLQLAATQIALGATAAAGLSSSFTAVVTALDSAKTSFAASITTLAGLTTPQASAKTALDKVAAEVAAGKTYLESGDDLINVATRGENVGAVYAQYATEQMRLASGYVNEAEGFLALVDSYIDKATREGVAGTGYTTEAVQRLGVLDRYLSQAERDEALGARYLEIAGRYLASGQAKINEFLAALGYKPEVQSVKVSSQQPGY